MSSSPARPGTGRLPLKPLAAAFAIAIALDAVPAAATIAAGPRQPQVLVVTNCNDSGAGSLRDVAGGAADGDTVDLTQLSCSVISLSTGAIVLGSDNLTLQGPGGHQLLLQGSGGSGAGVLYDLGGGTLTVNGLDIAFGDKYRSDHSAHGGCVYSAGNLAVSNAHIYACGVHAASYPAAGGALYAYGFVTVTNTDIDICGLTTTGPARGGGIFAGGDAIIAYSTITGCRNATSNVGYGGGVYAGGHLTVKYSTISDNRNDEGVIGNGGGAFSRGDATIFWSTISGNSAIVGGGLYMTGGSGYSANISESTISGNTAHAGGGARASLPISVYNSTIAFNTIPRSYSIPIGYAFAAGLSVEAPPVLIESTIISNNIAYGLNDDPEDLGGELSVTIGGSHNVIMSSAQATPPDTIIDDPQLDSLQDNGGPTLTHALRSASPAIDRGAANGFSTDQRGSGFPRVLGVTADIGAYESDPDRIFSNGFD